MMRDRNLCQSFYYIIRTSKFSSYTNHLNFQQSKTSIQNYCAALKYAETNKKQTEMKNMK